MQLPHPDPSLAEQAHPITDGPATKGGEAQSRKSPRFDGNSSISGSWPRTIIAVNGSEYQPFRVR